MERTILTGDFYGCTCMCININVLFFRCRLEYMLWDENEDIDDNDDVHEDEFED